MVRLHHAGLVAELELQAAPGASVASTVSPWARIGLARLAYRGCGCLRLLRDCKCIHGLRLGSSLDVDGSIYGSSFSFTRGSACCLSFGRSERRIWRVMVSGPIKAGLAFGAFVTSYSRQPRFPQFLGLSISATLQSWNILPGKSKLSVLCSSTMVFQTSKPGYACAVTVSPSADYCLPIPCLYRPSS